MPDLLNHTVAQVSEKKKKNLPALPYCPNLDFTNIFSNNKKYFPHKYEAPKCFYQYKNLNFCVENGYRRLWITNFRSIEVKRLYGHIFDIQDTAFSYCRALIVC